MIFTVVATSGSDAHGPHVQRHGGRDSADEYLSFDGGDLFTLAADHEYDVYELAAQRERSFSRGTGF